MYIQTNQRHGQKLLWVASIGKSIKTKVAWKYVIQTIVNDGLKILDPTIYEKVILTKLLFYNIP